MNQQKYILHAILVLCLSTSGYLFVEKLSSTQLIKEESESIDIGICGNVVFYNDTEIDGKNIFQQKCSSCHAVFKDLTGPALMNISERHIWSDTKQLTRYLRKPASFKKDEYIKTLRKKYGVKYHIAYPELSDEDVAAILRYIGAYSASVY